MLLPLPAPALAETVPPGAPIAALMVDQRVTPIAPGVTLTTFDQLSPRGWVRGYVLRADLTNPAISADLLYPGAVASVAPLSQLAARAGTVAAVNGDYFDINGSKAPLSGAVSGGTLLKGPMAGWPHLAGVGIDQVGRLADMALEGTLALPTGKIALSALNQHIPENGIGLFTSLWGAAPRKWAALWGRPVKEVTVSKGRVARIADTWGEGLIPADSFVLIGREKGAEALARLKVGDPVTVSYAPRTGAAAPFQFAVGGNDYLLKEGKLPDGLDDKAASPRSAIGFSADGKTLFLVTVDGRSEESGGMTLKELAGFLQEQGAASALNLDGGGSATMVARTPGTGAAVLTNAPSDGEERRVANGVGLFAVPGSGRLAGMTVVPKYGTDHAERVFPNLIRTWSLTGYDEAYGPAPVGAPTWTVEPAGSGLLLGSGLFVAGRPGAARLTATAGGVTVTKAVQVLGPLDRLIPSPGALALNDGAAVFAVAGRDAEGYSAPIEPANVTLSYDTSLLTITPTDAGGFRVEPKAEQVATVVTLSVGGKQALLPVTRGFVQTLASDFERPDGWRFSTYPTVVKGTLGAGAGRRGQGLRLDYDFATTPATRAAYADTSMSLPGRPGAFSLWVKGDGQGEWLRAVLTDAGGAAYTVNLAKQVDWKDWKYVQATIPDGVRYPVSVTRIYPVETDKARQYRGELVLDDLVAWEPVRAPLHEQPAVTPDPLFVPKLAAEAWRFALLPARTEEAVKAATAAGAEFVLVPGEVGSLYSFDQKGTRFVLLAPGAGDFARLTALKAALDGAEQDKAVRNVVVVAPTPAAAMADPRDSVLAERWLSEFRERSGGKGAAWLAGGSGPAAQAERIEGVPHVTVTGGTGWTLFGVGGPAEWLQAEVH
jgi:hypothetical protein